ncbi:hypothetical protein SB775_15470 [Peribacillus sp. SIMBA_075]|uniref:hypothetical protein n=1 Tax=Peribacillus sp. SIMBA_075 TaxID=3085813 RepID=UPI0007771ECA|nr:hypothetical protein UP17_08760 [Peribacillus simplex]
MNTPLSKVPTHLFGPVGLSVFVQFFPVWNGILLIYDWDFFRYWHKKTEGLPGKVPEKPSFLETYFYLSTLNFF